MARSPATKVAAWRQKWPGSLPNVRGTNEGSNNGQAVMVELLIDGIWTDLSILGLVLSADGVQINTRGRPGENAVSGPATCDFTAKNLDAAFSFSNPMSIYWGKVVLGTQVRVSVPRGNDKSIRFWGSLSMIPQVSDISGQYSVVTFESAGKLRPLGQNSAPLHSPLYREIIPSITDTSVVGGRLRAYWPMEDASGSQTIMSAYPGGSAMTFTGTGNLATYTGFTASDALPNMTGSIFRGAVTKYAPIPFGPPITNDSTEVCFLLSAPSGITAGCVLCEFTFVSGADKITATLTYSSTDHVTLSYVESDGTTTGTTGSVAMTVAGITQMVEIIASTSHGFGSSSLELDLYRQKTSSATHDFIGTVSIGPFSTNVVEAVTLNRTATVSDFYMGHLAVFEIPSSIWTVNGVGFESLSAYVGERADTRFDRLCTEEGLTHEVRGTYGLGVLSNGIFAPDSGSNSQAEGVTLGPQTVDTFMNLIRQCEASDDGIIYEMTTDYGLGYRTRRDLQNQAAVLTLTHSSHELSAPLTPLTDDSFVLNDVTVTRTGGSSYESVDTTSVRSVNPAPGGMGPYPTAYELSLQYDSQTGSEATWAVRKGTVNEARFKAVQVNLNSIELAGTAKRNTILDMIPGDRMVITGLPTSPARYGFEDISQLALGFTESIDQFQHYINLNCMPESPYRTGVVDTSVTSTGTHSDTGGSHMSGGIGTTDTSLTVVTDGFYVWADSASFASDFPFDIMMDGERMTVTAITGTSSPQTFTVTRSVNSVVKPHNDQANIVLYAAKAVSL